MAKEDAKAAGEDAETAGQDAASVGEEAGKEAEAPTDAKKPDAPLDVQEQGGRQSGVSEGAPEPEITDLPHTTPGAEGVDVDLTALSSTMVYAEVYSMMSVPEEYIGKTVKMDGLFVVYRDEESEQYYYACLILDATACCAQGLEFALKEEGTFPEDYPEVGSPISVRGTFDTYREGETTYCRLRDAEFL